MVDYTIAIKAVNNASRGINRVESDLKRLDSQAQRVSSSLRRVAQFAIAAGAGAVIRGITRQYLEYEKYQAVLTTFLGSQEKANAKLEELKSFANTIPQSLQDLTGAFVILQRQGIDNSAESLEAFADIAAGSGKSLNQLAEALADSITGEFERLKEFGIKVSKENDQFVARFGDQTVAVASSAKQLTDQLVDLGKSGGIFDGAAGNFAGTLTIAFSNLQGAVFNLSTAIGNLFAPAAIAAINAFAGAINFIADNIDRFVITAGVAAAVLGGRFAVAVGITAVKAVFSLVTSLKVLRGAIIRTGIGALIVIVGELIYQFTRLVEATGSIGEPFVLAKNVAVEVFGRLQLLGSYFVEFMGDVGFAVEAVFKKMWGNILIISADSIDTIISSLGGVSGKVAAALGIDTALSDALRSAGTDLSNSGDEFLGGLPDLLGSYGESIKLLATLPLESLAELRKKMEEAGVSTEETDEIIDKLGDTLGNLGPKIDPPITGLQKFTDLVKDAGKALASDLATSIRTGEGILSSFGSFFTGLMDQIVAKILEVAFVKPILDSLFGAGGTTAGFLGSLGDLFAGGFATGGQIPGGKFGLVGENGPELISGPGRVYSNSDSAAMLGNNSGGGVIAPVFNTTINPGQDTSPEAAREFANNFNKTIEAKVTDTIIKMQNRGGGGFQKSRSY